MATKKSKEPVTKVEIASTVIVTLYLNDGRKTDIRCVEYDEGRIVIRESDGTEWVINKEDLPNYIKALQAFLPKGAQK